MNLPASTHIQIACLMPGGTTDSFASTPSPSISPNKLLKKRPIWLGSPGNTSYSPTRSHLAKHVELFEDQLQAIRAKLRASSFFSGGEDWERLFKRADKDGNGVIDEEELVKICSATVKGAAKGFSVNERDVRALFHFLDSDCDGGIQYEEFEKFLEGRTNFRISEQEQAEAMELLKVTKATTVIPILPPSRSHACAS